MQFWYLENLSRLAEEKEAIRQLQLSSKWLQDVHWTMIDAQLGFKAIIQTREHDYPIEFIYPNLYPCIPPIVRPQDKTAIWSEHQYLSGTLCLEWGPDNWVPSISGAKVLESAFELLCTVNPTDEIDIEPLPSRHKLTLGQELRGSPNRLHINADMLNYLYTLPHTFLAQIAYSLLFRQDSTLAVIHKVKLERKDVSAWIHDVLPSSVFDTPEDGFLFKADFASDILEKISDVSGLQDVLNAFGFNLSRDLTSQRGLILLVDIKYRIFALCVEGNKLFHFRTVLSNPSEYILRFPDDNALGLRGKSVAILGVGSMGSKIALSLARSGVKDFYLIDDDIFLPENICRHVLDWGDVTSHKVDGVKSALSRLDGNIKVRTSHVNISGQESTSVLSSTLDQVAEYDVIVDATANPEAFNVLVAVAEYYGKPIVWAEVYAGGIGGLIARSRPNIDPPPQTMRRILLSYLAEHPNNYQMQIVGNYSLHVENEIVTATDADVSVIASHVSRLIIDTLSDEDNSEFPQSMYLIGLRQGWLFKAPFHTIPINTDHTSEVAQLELSEDVKRDIFSFLQSVIASSKNEDSIA